NCGGAGGCASIAHADAREPVLRDPRWSGSSRNDFATWRTTAVNSFRYLCTFAAFSLMLLSACSSPPGRPTKDSEDPAPSEISDFRTLYAENCAGCHGTDGRGGPAVALADPVYLAIIDKSSIRKGISNGVQRKSMPALAPSGGGI